MNATAALPIVGVSLSKSVFQLAIADASWRVVEEGIMACKRLLITRMGKINPSIHDNLRVDPAINTLAVQGSDANWRALPSIIVS